MKKPADGGLFFAHVLRLCLGMVACAAARVVMQRRGMANLLRQQRADDHAEEEVERDGVGLDEGAEIASDACKRDRSCVLRSALMSRGGDPLGVEDWATTIYHTIGIVADKELMAPGNRPIEIVDNGKVVKDLLV